jgi:hypothetical protein
MYFLHISLGIAPPPGAAMNHNAADKISFAFPTTMWKNKNREKPYRLEQTDIQLTMDKPPRQYRQHRGLPVQQCAGFEIPEGSEHVQGGETAL